MQREENHAIQNARGWSATITALVAALNADYDRLEELRDERESLTQEVSEQLPPDDPAVKALDEWDAANLEELRDLTAAVTVDGEEFQDAEAVAERIQESPLSVEVRSGWYSPADRAGAVAEEFAVLLSTGGPALRIRGELDEHSEPRRAWLEYQDWGTPWTEFHGDGAPSQDDLLAFCRSFYFGE